MFWLWLALVLGGFVGLFWLAWERSVGPRTLYEYLALKALVERQPLPADPITYAVCSALECALGGGVTRVLVVAPGMPGDLPGALQVWALSREPGRSLGCLVGIPTDDFFKSTLKVFNSLWFRVRVRYGGIVESCGQDSLKTKSGGEFRWITPGSDVGGSFDLVTVVLGESCGGICGWLEAMADGQVVVFVPDLECLTAVEVLRSGQWQVISNRAVH